MAAVISPSLPASSVLDFLHPTLFDMDLPPSYSPSSCAPSYSAEPGPSEQRLEFASRRKQTPDGMLRRMQNGMTVVLLDQDEHAERPIYGRGGLVRGYVDLSNSHTITSVTAALEGRMDITFGEAADSHWTFLNSSYTIWEENGEETCPPVLPLERIFPTSFEDPIDGRERPLPPSYNPKVSSMRGLKVQVEYTLVVRVTRLGLLWNQEKILSLPLTYIPRSRPHRPIVSSPFPFLPTFKSLAEEWRHLNVAMPSTSPLLGEIDCNLLIPEVQIFGKDDTIPFFLQLRAPTATMRALFCPMPTKGHRPLSWQPQAGSSEPKIRVFVRRQVTAMAYGTKVVRSYIIAEGDLRPIPPNGDTPGDELVVDYEGDMKLTPKVKVGGFNAGRFNVLDYIVLSITPAGSHSSLFEEVNLVHGIRIVTDSCTME